MQDLTPEGLETVQNLARNYSMSVDAVTTLLRAVAAGNGYQAQFSHPELGGMGQWSQGGMIMIGDMFNNNLKATVSSLADALSGALRNQQMFKPVNVGSNSSFFVGGGPSQWPAELGSPSSSGGQNDMQYAFFPDKRRLAIRYGGNTTVYDTGDHNIYGFGQQQGGDQSLTFNSQYGVVRVADLPQVQIQQGSIQQGAQATSFSSSNNSFSSSNNFSPAPPASEPAPQAQAFAPAFDNSFPAALPASPQAAPAATGATHDEILQTLEKLAALRDKKILSDAEFESKKAELLSRL
jgi:hypothetical protein